MNYPRDLIDVTQMLSLTGLSWSEIQRAIAGGGFPTMVTGDESWGGEFWRRSEVEAWITARKSNT